MAEKPKLPLGKLLILKGVISEDQLRIALIEQKTSGVPLGKLLIALGFVTEATVREALSENLNQQSTDLTSIIADSHAIKLISKDIAKRYRVFPMVYDKNQRNLMLAMADTANIVALDQINAMLGKDVSVTPMLAAESEIIKAIDQYYGFELSIDGILPDIMAGNIIGVVAQRLVRRLCAHCKEPFVADEVERRLLGLSDVHPDVTIHRAGSCAKCSHQGYKGRISIFEMLKLNAELDDLIARRATIREIRNAALAMGFRPLVEDAVRRVLDASTSLDEISRVVDLTDRLM